MNEIACQFSCACNETNNEHELLGICHPSSGDTGILIVTGGPQYRIGSHRQFLLIARDLANEGYPVFRFDYRGMGDSGTLHNESTISFEQTASDISAAISAFSQQQPQMKKLVLLGLCDGASAILIAMPSLLKNKLIDITGLTLINPWVFQETTTAKTYLKYYYIKRLAESDFWLRLFKLKINILHSLKSIIQKINTAFLHNEKPQQSDYINDMLIGLLDFDGEVLTLLSEDDLTAQEFASLIQENKIWSKTIQNKKYQQVDILGANHTFSTIHHREKVVDNLKLWLNKKTNATPD